MNWNTGRAPDQFLETMRRAGRLQVNSKCQEEPWLCPSHPDNQKLEIDSMVEVARRYETLSLRNGAAEIAGFVDKVARDVVHS